MIKIVYQMEVKDAGFNFYYYFDTTLCTNAATVTS